MKTATRTLTLAGKKYRLSTRSYDGRVQMAGPGVLSHICLPEGVTLDSPDLRGIAQAALERDRECRRAAAEYIQAQVRAAQPGRPLAEAAQS